MTSKGIFGIAAIIGIIAILLIPQVLTPDSFADISRAKNLLKYEPKVSFKDGLKLTVDWYARIS